MNSIKKIAITVVTIFLASTIYAADPDAADLEKRALGYWAPDAKAMLKLFTEEKGMEKKDAETLIGESSTFTVHVEKGLVHLYAKQGILSMPFKIDAVDKENSTVTLRPDGGPDAPPAQPMKFKIEKERITVEGSQKGQVPFILKKIEKAEFEKRRKKVPARPVGP